MPDDEKSPATPAPKTKTRIALEALHAHWHLEDRGNKKMTVEQWASKFAPNLIER